MQSFSLARRFTLRFTTEKALYSSEWRNWQIENWIALMSSIPDTICESFCWWLSSGAIAAEFVSGHLTNRVERRSVVCPFQAMTLINFTWMITVLILGKGQTSNGNKPRRPDELQLSDGNKRFQLWFEKMNVRWTPKIILILNETINFFVSEWDFYSLVIASHVENLSL